jgi:hypothetical protein
LARGHPEGRIMPNLPLLFSMASDEETPLFKKIEKCDRFSPARKRLVLALVSFIGILPCSSMSILHLQFLIAFFFLNQCSWQGRLFRFYRRLQWT